MKKLKVLWFVLLTLNLKVQAYPLEIAEDYCRLSGGTAEEMTAKLATHSGWMTGLTKSFCNFKLPHGFVSIGLETFATEEPNIAATYMKILPEISADSPLWRGSSSIPSYNVCKNLGGAVIGFVTDGGFADDIGQLDMCIFGDDSMVSGWTLIYMANHNEGYEEIKQKVKATPLDIDLPK